MVDVVEFQEHQYDEKCMALKAKCFLEFIGHSAKESREREREGESFGFRNNYSMFARFHSFGKFNLILFQLC